MIELLTESKKTGAQCWCLIGVRIVDNCLHDLLEELAVQGAVVQNDSGEWEAV